MVLPADVLDFLRVVMKKYALIGALLFAQGGYVVSIDARAIFPTLTQVQQYAESLPEHIETETDWLNPDFSLFHKERVPGRMRRLINWFGLGRRAWNPHEFNRLLRSLIKKRELNGLMGDFIQKYQAASGERIFIWTDSFGAFHSLVRDLGELRSKGIIGDDLKIAKPEYLFVFNGNVIDHSPYVLETLTLVMRLLEANPQQVIYTRGDHEDKQEWHSYGLARELKMRAAGLSRETIPLNKLVTQFFNTLPLGLFLPQVTEKEIDVVLIANNEYSKSGFEVKKIAGFLEKEENGRLSSFKLSNKLTAKKSVHVKVLISGEDRSITYHQTPGLSMLGMQREALRWLSFSSPTSRNRRLYEFFNDAFVELEIQDQLDDWTLTLYNQDVRKLFGFKKVATYDLLTGRRIKEGVKKSKKKAPPKEKEKKKEPPKEPSKKPEAKPPKEEKKKEEPESTGTQEAVIGSTLDLSKSASMIGKPVKEGLEIAFKQMTQAGGAGSFLPRIVMYDDGYTPSKTRSLVKDFLDKSNVDIFLNSVGSPTTESYLDLIKEGKVLVLFPYTGAPIFRKPELKSIAHMRVGYVDEGRALAEYALDELQARKIVIFYQNDAFGRGALQGAMEIFKKRGKDVIQVPYERNDVQFDQQAKIIEQTDPDTIFFFAVTPSARSLIRQLGVSFLRGRNLIGMSVYDESFERFLESKGLKFVMVRVVPNPKTSELEIVKEYRDAAKGTNHVLNFNSLESFINAGIFFDILKRIKPPLTKEKIIKEIESIKNYNFKGIELDFDPNSRELVRTLWLDTGEGPWIKKEVRLPSDERAAKEEKKVEKIPEKKKEAKKTKKEELKEPKKKEHEVTPAPKKEKPSEKKKRPEVAPGEKEEITFGSTMDLSKSASPIGKRVKEGLTIRFDQERKAKTVPNVELSLITQDDQYTPQKTRKEVGRFIDSLNITKIIGSQGSPSLESYLDWIKEGKVLVLFPFTGAPIFRKPDLKNLVHFRGSYIREGEELINYALDKLKARKIVIFYQNDAFGKGPLEGARRALKAAGVTDFVEVPHERNDVNFKKHAKIIKKADPDVILFSTNATPIRGIIRQMGVGFFSGKSLLGVSVYEDAFEQFLKDKGLKFILTRMVPDPRESEIEIAKEYREAADAAGTSYDKVSFEQYINASILFDMLKRISGPITNEKIIEMAEKTKNYSFKGLLLDFDPETRELSPVLWLDTGEGPWIEKSARDGKVKTVEPPAEPEKEAVKEPETKKEGEEPEKKEEKKEPEEKEKKAEEPTKTEPVVEDGEKKPLTLGSPLGLTRAVKFQSKSVKAGIDLRLKEEREAGESVISQVIVVDDEYTPRKTVKEVRRFLEQGIDILLTPMGSPTLAAYLDLVREGKVLVLFPMTGAPLFRKKDLKYMAHIRPSYTIEGKLLAEYALDTLKAKKGVMFYQDDAFGQGLLEGAQEELKKRGITNWLAVPYQRNDVTFAKQVARIKKYDPDVLLFFSVTTAARGLIRQLGIQEVAGKHMLANSDFGEEEFQRFMKEKGLKMFYLNAVPNPQQSDIAIAKQFRDAANREGVPIDVFSLESYLATDFLIDIVKKIQGAATKEKIINAIAKVKNHNYKGMLFNFDPENRTLSSTLWMYTGSPDWQQIEVQPNKEDTK